jgi:hypothetical protein
MRISLLLVAVAAGLATACASSGSTPYQPAGINGDYGYAEQQLEHNKVRLTFSGNSLTDVATVKKYVLYRAAEVTLQSGYDFFILADRGLETESEFRSTGFRLRFGGEIDEKSSHQAMIDITMFSGRKPPVLPNAYDAREVRQNLGSSLERPRTS